MNLALVEAARSGDLMLESWRLIEGGAVGLGIANLIGSSVTGMVAVVVGLMIGRAIA